MISVLAFASVFPVPVCAAVSPLLRALADDLVEILAAK